MNRQVSLSGTLTGVLLVLAAIAAPVWATLPAAVDGQPLPSLAPMLEKVTPAVVNIHSKSTERVANPLSEDAFFRYFFGLPAMPRQRVRQSLGSGVVVDAEKGLVLTNNHVVEGADDIAVTLADGRTLNGKLVGSDPDTDVALVKVPARDLTAVPLAESNALRVGDFVVAVGNPFGLGQTVTSGIVSALGRSGLNGLGYQNFIQTDASINPGNSGGALVNLRGELVGINTAIFSPSGGNVGIGFAIPSDLARDVMRQLLAYGEVRRGSLGLETQDITDELAELLALNTRHGAVVTRVYRNSPAEHAGIKPGDVVTAVNDQAVADRQSLHNIEGLLAVGKPVPLTLVRNGKQQQTEVVLTARKQRLKGVAVDARLSGATLAELPERDRQQGRKGVLVAEVEADSRAAMNGLQAGDVIAAINNQEVDGLDDLQTQSHRTPRQLIVTVVRGRQAGSLAMQ